MVNIKNNIQPIQYEKEKPWLDAFNSNDKKKIITDEMIKDYYKIEMLNHLL